MPTSFGSWTLDEASIYADETADYDQLSLPLFFQRLLTFELD